MSLSEIIEEFGGLATIIDLAIFLCGLSFFFIWMVKTTFGSKALADSAPRHNDMAIYTPFIPFLIWFGGVSVSILIIDTTLRDFPEWVVAFLENVILCAGSIGTTVVIVYLVRKHFLKKLRGFGLNFQTIHKDFSAAVVNLVTVLPMVMLMIVLTMAVGKLIWGPDFQLSPHEELEIIMSYPQMPLRVLIIVTAVVIVPVFEEMLFRGMLQTMIRSQIERPWLAIIICAGLFAMVHGNISHWPALFALAMCLGYSYEKSGSLFRPIFIHSFFNALSIAAALNSV